jgi:hypothetical protein
MTVTKQSDMKSFAGFSLSGLNLALFYSPALSWVEPGGYEMSSILADQ